MTSVFVLLVASDPGAGGAAEHRDVRASLPPLSAVVDIGGPKDVYTLRNYGKIFENGNPTSIFGIPVTLPIHIKTFLDTVFYASLVTLFTLILAYPLAYFLASPRWIPTLLLLLFIPMWVSEALRAFAWYVILTYNGPLERAVDRGRHDRQADPLAERHPDQL